MKKTILKLGKALKKEVQKEINGGVYPGSGEVGPGGCITQGNICDSGLTCCSGLACYDYRISSYTKTGVGVCLNDGIPGPSGYVRSKYEGNGG